MPATSLPFSVAQYLFGFLCIADCNALVRAYPDLRLSLIRLRASMRPWQACIPVELLRAIMEFLTPADFYTACCTCTFWRACGTSNSRLVKTQLEAVLSNSRVSTYDLALVSPIPESTPADRLWVYFLVAAPRRYMFMDGMRRHRVVTLDLRQPLRNQVSHHGSKTMIFLSDYGGIIAVATASSLAFHTIEDLLPAPPRLSASGRELGNISHPRGVSAEQLVDVSIAHQQGTTGTFNVFALYDGGSVFHATLQLFSIPETHLKQASFSKFTLVYGGPPSETSVSCYWTTDSPPLGFRAVQLAAVAPAFPARTLLALHAPDSVQFAIVRPSDAESLAPPPIRSKRSQAAIDFMLRKSRISITRAGPGGKPWDLLLIAHPELASSDWRAHQVDRLAIKEVFLEWFHSNSVLRTPVLKSVDVMTGAHLLLEGLVPLHGALSPKGVRFVAGTPLQSPHDVGSASPTQITALQYLQRCLLVAAYWPQTQSIYLYDGTPADFLAGRLAPRRLVAFSGSSAHVQSLRFIGGYTSAPDEPPCAGKIILTVIMAAGFVHLCQLTATDLNGQVEWALPASCKLQGVSPNNSWPCKWVASSDGSMSAQNSDDL